MLYGEVVYRPWPGSRLDRVANEVVCLANALQVNVELTFNDTTLIVVPANKPAEIVAAYYSTLTIENG